MLGTGSTSDGDSLRQRLLPEAAAARYNIVQVCTGNGGSFQVELVRFDCILVSHSPRPITYQRFWLEPIAVGVPKNLMKLQSSWFQASKGGSCVSPTVFISIYLHILDCFMSFNRFLLSCFIDAWFSLQWPGQQMSTADRASSGLELQRWANRNSGTVSTGFYETIHWHSFL